MISKNCQIRTTCGMCRFLTQPSRSLDIPRKAGTRRQRFHPMEEKIHVSFIPSLTGQHILGEQERKLLALPSRLGGLGISNPEEAADEQYDASLRTTAPLAALIVQQETSIATACEEVQKVRKKIRKESRQRQENRAQTLKDGPMQRHLELASEKGASTWLEALPIKDQCFHLSRNEFRDSLCLRYGWRPPKLPAA